MRKVLGDFPALVGLEGCAVLAHRLPLHAREQALLEAAELALVARLLVDDALLVLAALVLQVLLHGALEEALAAFAAVDAVVEAAALVATDGACAHRLQVVHVEGN